MELSDELRGELLLYQGNEITEHHIYTALARVAPLPENQRILEKIAADELRHYHQWRAYTHQDVEPNRRQVLWYYWISRIFGLTFGIKLMERGEESAQVNYGHFHGIIPEADDIAREENEHEQALIGLLDEERLRYIGSIVLGLNDALVELTGALAGLTLALRDTKLVALTGSVTGIAAAMSMAASEYLSTKSEEGIKDPLRASLYTGIAYIATVLTLILPYLILKNLYLCLACTLLAAVGIIAFFNYYISVAKDVPFRQRFLEMTGLSLAVTILSFLIGTAIRSLLGVEV
ncbi:MAG: VIT1/CCC1 transporter family protein [Anaerolineae bacterium]